MRVIADARAGSAPARRACILITPFKQMPALPVVCRRVACTDLRFDYLGLPENARQSARSIIYTACECVHS